MAEAEFQSHFSPNKPLEPDILSELESMQRLHDLSVEDLFYKWESYCIKLDLDAQAISLPTVRNLKQALLDDLEKTQRQAQVKPERRPAATPRPGAARGGDVFGMLDGLVPSTPATGGRLGRVAGGGSSLKRKMETPKGPASSPANGLGEQLKSLNGLG